LFQKHGMLLEELAVHERAITNRGQGVRMDRRWVQASFASAAVPADALPTPPPPEEPAWMTRRRVAEGAAAAREAANEAAGVAEAETEAMAAAVAAREEAAAAAVVTSCDRRVLEGMTLELLREGRVTPQELLIRLSTLNLKFDPEFVMAKP